MRRGGRKEKERKDTGCLAVYLPPHLSFLCLSFCPLVQLVKLWSSAGGELGGKHPQVPESKASGRREWRAHELGVQTGRRGLTFSSQFSPLHSATAADTR